MISSKNNKKLPTSLFSHLSDHLNLQSGKRIEGETKQFIPEKEQKSSHCTLLKQR